MAATTSKTSTTAKKTTAKTTAKKTTAKKTTAKKTTAKKPAAKKPAAKSSGSRIQVTATEKKLVELYRAADSDTKKAALMLLKGEKQQTSGILSSILGDNNLMNNLSGLFPGFNLTRDINEEE